MGFGKEFASEKYLSSLESCEAGSKHVLYSLNSEVCLSREFANWDSI